MAIITYSSRLLAQNGLVVIFNHSKISQKFCINLIFYSKNPGWDISMMQPQVLKENFYRGYSDNMKENVEFVKHRSMVRKA